MYSMWILHRDGLSKLSINTGAIWRTVLNYVRFGIAWKTSTKTTSRHSDVNEGKHFVLLNLPLPLADTNERHHCPIMSRYHRTIIMFCCWKDINLYSFLCFHSFSKHNVTFQYYISIYLAIDTLFSIIEVKILNTKDSPSLFRSLYS